MWPGVDAAGIQRPSSATGSAPPSHLAASSASHVVSIVARSNTGKTTLIEGLLPHLRDLGLRVGVLKHHSHPSSFDVPGKDTFRLAEAGADVVVGVSPLQVAVFRQHNDDADIDELIARHFTGLDLVLTEGHKRGPYPKIEVHRSERSDELLCGERELLALVSDRSWRLPVPQFSLVDRAGLASFIGDHVRVGDRPLWGGETGPVLHDHEVRASRSSGD